MTDAGRIGKANIIQVADVSDSGLDRTMEFDREQLKMVADRLKIPAVNISKKWPK